MSEHDQVSSSLDKAFLALDRQMVPLNKPIMKIGRNADNDVIIKEVQVSRWHAEIRYTGDQFVISDMGSKFGTKVNGQEIETYVLQSGDNILLAGIPMLFIVESDSLKGAADDATGVLQLD